MELIIDTWNVLHQTGILPPESAGIETRGLVGLIQTSRWGGERITLVCDGTPSDNTACGPRVKTMFSGPNRSADEEIIRLVTQSSSARSILVVTSDREIIRSIKAKGAQQIGSAAFLQALVDDHATPKKKQVRRPSGLSPERAEEWKQEFGIDEEVLKDLHNTPMPNFQKEKDPVAKPTKSAVPQEKTKRTIKPDEPMLPDDLLQEARQLIRRGLSS